MDPLHLILAFAMGLVLWQRLRASRPQAAHFDEALQVVVRGAAQQARSRAEPLEPLHFLQALLRDETIRGAAQRLGAKVDAIERWIVARLDGTLRSASLPRLYSDKALAVLQRTIAPRAGAGQSARLMELLAALIRVEPATAEACAAGGIRAVDLLFVLVHGAPEAELRVPAGDELKVVLVNDDISTMELVVEVLQTDLAMSHDDAVELMTRVHRSGRAEAGRFAAGEALERVRAAHQRARRGGFPLLLQLEA